MLKPNPSIMRDNPLSKIPTLVLDDGSALFDSAVICEYLDDQAGGALFPSEPASKWPSMRWHAFADGLLEVMVLWRNERDRDLPLQALMDAFEIKAQACLRRLEEETGSLAAAPFSIAHIAMGCTLGYFDYRFDTLQWRKTAPRLADWHAATISRRPSFLATEPADG